MFYVYTITHTRCTLTPTTHQESFIAGLRPFVETAGIVFAHTHSPQWARSIFKGEDYPQLPFAAVIRDWDFERRSFVATQPLRNLDDDRWIKPKDLIAFFFRHWMPILPRLEASFSQQHNPQEALGIVLAVIRDSQDAQSKRSLSTPQRRNQTTKYLWFCSRSLRFLELVRNVAFEHKHGEADTRWPSFAWIEGPPYRDVRNSPPSLL